MLLGLTATAQSVYEWVEIPRLPTQPPTTGNDGLTNDWELVWDAQRQLVLAAERYYIDPTSTAWTWDGSAWTNTGIQTPQRSRGLVYHGSTGTVYRLQMTGTLEPMETLAFVPEVGWVQVDSEGPTSRLVFGWAYDARRQRTVLFGGSNGGSLETAHTWEWDGSDWVVYDTLEDGPSRRSSPAMAYDERNEVIVLFGGTGEGGTRYGDTWTWDGVQWQHVADSGPAPRTGAAMIYDSDRQKVLLFGGFADDELGDLWEWDGSEWTSIGAVGPLARSSAGFAYDEARQEGVMYSGLHRVMGTPIPLPDMWRLRVREAWVDFAYNGFETGDFETPYNTLAEAVQALPPEGKVRIKPGTGSETIVITKWLHLSAPLGNAVVGD